MSIRKVLSGAFGSNSAYSCGFAEALCSLTFKLPKRCYVKSLLAIFLCFIVMAVPVYAGQAVLNEKPEVEEMESMGYRLVVEHFDDKFSSIPGNETHVRVYVKGKATMALFSLPNGLVYAYAYKSGKHPLVAYIDEDNDGYCERTIDADEEFTIDLKAYGL